MNTIVVDDVTKIPQVLNYTENFIFDSCELIFEDYKCVIESKAKIEYIESVDEYCEYLSAIINDLSDTHKIKILLNDGCYCGVELIDTTHTKWEKAIGRCEYPAEMILSICNYIMTTKRDKVARQLVSSITRSNEKGNAKANKTKKVYLLDEIVEYVNENSLAVSENGTHKITCPCWSVRGHYRHLKSGKAVFVRSYEKGKDKGNSKAVDKTYIVGKRGVSNV